MDHSLGSHPGQRSLIPLLERKVRVRFGAFVLIVMRRKLCEPSSLEDNLHICGTDSRTDARLG
jgi:hypothetical protein